MKKYVIHKLQNYTHTLFRHTLTIYKRLQTDIQIKNIFTIQLAKKHMYTNIVIKNITLYFSLPFKTTSLNQMSYNNLVKNNLFSSLNKILNNFRKIHSKC